MRLRPRLSANVASAAPCRLSRVHTRKNALTSGCDSRSAAASGPTVRPSATVEGAICASPASFVSGISDFATFELNGPTIASTLGSPMNVLTFCAPAAGSCFPCTASSSRSGCTVKRPPPTPRASACSIARIAPFAVGCPSDASAPLSGMSIPTFTVVRFAGAAEPGAPDGAGADEDAPPAFDDAFCAHAASSAASTPAPANRTNPGTVIPVATSARRIVPGRLHGRQLPHRGGVEVRGARVVDHDRRRRLLRHDLVRGRQRRADRVLHFEQAPHDLVLREVGARAVPPAVALPALFGEPELAADAVVRVLGERFGRLHAEAVEEVRLAVVVARLQRFGAPRGFAPDGHDLQRDDVARAAVLRLAHVVGEAQVLAAGLPGEGEARDLPLAVRGIVHDHVVAAPRRREVAVHDARLQERLRLSEPFVAAETWLELFGEEPFPLGSLRVRAAPREPVQAAQVEARPQLAHVDVRHG